MVVVVVVVVVVLMLLFHSNSGTQKHTSVTLYVQYIVCLSGYVEKLLFFRFNVRSFRLISLDELVPSLWVNPLIFSDEA